jgi:hypothetical protein
MDNQGTSVVIEDRKPAKRYGDATGDVLHVALPVTDENVDEISHVKGMVHVVCRNLYSLVCAGSVIPDTPILHQAAQA